LCYNNYKPIFHYIRGVDGLVDKKNKVLIKINGQEYPIVGSEPKDYLLKVGNYVDEKMDEVRKGNQRLSTSMIAVLTSINMADDLLKLQEKLNNAQGKYEEPLQDLEELKTQYQKLESEHKNLEEENLGLKRNNGNLLKFKEKYETESIELKEEAKSRKEESEKAEKIINELQNKLFENQIKLVQARKQLEKYQQ
jgi:cell division protein ZapA